MKKFLFNAVALVLAVATYLLGLAPAISSKVTVAGKSSTSTTSFYEIVKNYADADKTWGLGVAIIVILSIGLVAILASLAFTYLKKKAFAKYAAFAAALLLVAVGVMFFCINADVGGSGSFMGVSAKTSLGVGAIFAGICSIASGAAAGYGAVASK